jgi:DNA-binding protein H-NS
MAKQSLLTMSVDALLKMRDDIADVLKGRADQLRRDLLALGSDARRVGRPPKGSASSKLTGRRVKAKYRDPATGATWSGRGAPAGWVAEYEKQGRKREEFLIAASAAKKGPAKKAAGRK